MALGDRSIVVACLRNAAAHDGRVIGLADHDLGFGALFFEDPSDPFEGAACTEAGDPVVQRLTFEISQDFLGRCLRVNVGVGLVLELATQKPTMDLGQFLSFEEHARALLRGRRQHHLCAQKTQDLAPLDREVLGHRDHQRVALLGTDHRQTDAGVAAGRFDHRLPR